jgi:hypothetical protein
MPDRHAVADERKVPAEKCAGGRGEIQHAVLDEAHDRQCGQALRPARDGELRVDRVGHAAAAVRKAVGFRELDPVAAVHADRSREAALIGDPIHPVLEAIHPLHQDRDPLGRRPERGR